MDNKTNDLENYAYFVSVEWGGLKPPTTWYTRINEMGFYIRGVVDGEKRGVLAGRAALAAQKGNEPRGVAFQEGYYLCKTRDTAKLLMSYARRYGAQVQLSGRLIVEDFMMSQDDIKAIDVIVQQTSKRGPKAAENKGIYTVMCFDEIKTYEVELNDTPFACPMCSCFHYLARPGKRGVFQKPQGDGVDWYQFWIDSRFSNENSTFEIPEVRESHIGDEILPTAPRSTVTVDLPALVDPMPDEIRAFSGDDYLHLLDVLYTYGQVVHDDNIRVFNRLKVLDAYWAAGGNTPFSMAAPENGVDLIDICYFENSYTKFLK